MLLPVQWLEMKELHALHGYALCLLEWLLQNQSSFWYPCKICNGYQLQWLMDRRAIQLHRNWAWDQAVDVNVDGCSSVPFADVGYAFDPALFHKNSPNLPSLLILVPTPAMNQPQTFWWWGIEDYGRQRVYEKCFFTSLVVQSRMWYMNRNGTTGERFFFPFLLGTKITSVLN